MFPIDSLKENMFFYFSNATHTNTVFSITAKPVHRTSSCDKQILRMADHSHHCNNVFQLSMPQSLKVCQFITGVTTTIQLDVLKGPTVIIVKSPTRINQNLKTSFLSYTNIYNTQHVKNVLKTLSSNKVTIPLNKMS